jgi:hypothetical protein
MAINRSGDDLADGEGDAEKLGYEHAGPLQEAMLVERSHTAVVTAQTAAHSWRRVRTG